MPKIADRKQLNVEQFNGSEKCVKLYVTLSTYAWFILDEEVMFKQNCDRTMQNCNITI